jgi:hypothetical protein
LRQRAAAAVNPALVRSRIKSRSNWPSAPNTWKMSRPPDVVVSMASVSERKPTPPRFQCPYGFDQMRQRAPEPIEPPHDQGISFPHIGQGRRQAGPVGLRARNGVLEDLVA